MVNWKEIHPDFTEKLQKEWEEWGFSYEKVKELIDSDSGLNITDAGFVWWIKEEKRRGFKWSDFKNYEDELRQKLITDIQELRNEYNNSELKKWGGIHREFVEGRWQSDSSYWWKWKSWSGFTSEEAKEWIDAGFKPSDYEKVKEWKSWYFTAPEAREWTEIGFDSKNSRDAKDWKEQGFTSQQTQEWIKAGLEKGGEAEFATYLKKKGITPTTFEQEDQVKHWFDCLLSSIPLDYREELKELGLKERNLTGSLVIDGNDWPQMKEIKVIKNRLVSAQITNCPQLTSVFLSENQLTSLIINNCPNLKELVIGNNKIKTDLSFLKELTSLEGVDLSNNPFYGSLKPLNKLNKLKILWIDNTNLDGDLGYLPGSLEEIRAAGELVKTLEPYKKKDGDGEYDYQAWRKEYIKDYVFEEMYKKLIETEISDEVKKENQTDSTTKEKRLEKENEELKEKLTKVEAERDEWRNKFQELEQTQSQIQVPPSKKGESNPPLI